jgi:hypothetical protein
MSANVFSAFIVVGDSGSSESSNHIICHVGIAKFGFFFVKAIPEA